MTQPEMEGDVKRLGGEKETQRDMEEMREYPDSETQRWLAWGQMGMRWEEAPSLSTARAAAFLTPQNNAHLRGRSAPDCGRRSSRQQPVRPAWTSVSVGNGRRGKRSACRPHANRTPSCPCFPSVQGQAGVCAVLRL